MNQLVSECCTALPFLGFGVSYGIYLTEDNTYIGICGECKEKAIFQCEGDA